MACTADDITCALEALTRAVQKQQPSDLDWLTFGVALLGVLASTFVGVAAWRTSRQAVKIADAAQQGAYETGLDAALGQFFAAAGDHLAELRQWLVMPPSLTPAGLVVRLLAPMPLQANAQFEAARLRARGDDAATLTTLSQWWYLVSEGAPEERTEGTTSILQGIREWRSGTFDHAAIRVYAEKALRPPGSE